MKKEYRTFTEAKKFVHSLKLKNQREWATFCKSDSRSESIPTTPARTYKKEWTSWGDFLGTGFVATKNKKFIPFNDARKFVQQFNLTNSADWKKFCKSGNRPNNIPTHPHVIYKNKGWINLGDWLGTGFVATKNRKYASFNDARKFVIKLKLKSIKDWDNYCKSGNIPSDIPQTPRKIYENKGWTSWGDFLSTGNVAHTDKKFLSFEKARKLVQNFNLKNSTDWKKFCKSGNRPNNIPTHPHVIYKNKGWISWGDFFGTGTLSPQVRSKNFLSFSDAKEIVHKLAKKYNIQTNKDWNDAVKKGLIPDNIPSTPRVIYSKKRKNEKKV